MKNTLPILFLFFCSLYHLPLWSQEDANVDNGGFYLSGNDAQEPCISLQQYKDIETRSNDNARLYINNSLSEENISAVTYGWPLKAAANLKDCSYYFISAHVDQNTAASAIKDYNCGSKTYDGHRGTDIATWPFGFYKMDHDQVEVVAVAAGSIVDKADGNFDRNCGVNSLAPNYIVIQHADGSRTLYAHMKKNSLTTKTVGQNVAAGEYLGIVGSSGSSSGPHLHFEVWSGSTAGTYNDPFSGTCNTLNANSWWTAQKPYTEPAVIKASVNTAAPIMPACPATETPNEDSCFSAGGSAVFATFIRNETPSTSAIMKILNPNSSTFSSWNQPFSATYNAAFHYWSKTLPSNPGTYTFEATYNGVTCSQKFKIGCVLSAIRDLNTPSLFRVYPNPSAGKFTLAMEDRPALKAGAVDIYNMMGALIYSARISEKETPIQLYAPGGLYYYLVKEGQQIVASGKLAIQ